MIQTLWLVVKAYLVENFSTPVDTPEKRGFSSLFRVFPPSFEQSDVERCAVVWTGKQEVRRPVVARSRYWRLIHAARAAVTRSAPFFRASEAPLSCARQPAAGRGSRSRC